MDDNRQANSRGTALCGLLIALGLGIGGWVLGAQIKATRLADRYVTVKGPVERRVKSDLAICALTYKEAGAGRPVFRNRVRHGISWNSKSPYGRPASIKSPPRKKPWSFCKRVLY